MRKNKSLFPVFFFSVLFIGLLFVTHSGSTVAQTNSACMDSCYSEFGSCIDNYCTPLTSEVDADACKGQCHQNAAVCEGNCRSATEDVIPDPTPVPSPEEDQETVPQLDYDFTREFESLAGGLARPFDEIFWRTTPIVPKWVRDPQGQEINLDEIAKDWKKVAPIVKVNYPVENIEAGQPVSMELPEGLPLKKALFLTAGPVTYADTEVTIFDGKTTPRLLREEEKGGPIGVDEDEYIEAPN
ncbi:MAG TPA: hypothetical protein VJB91_03305, partial [Patescibacteria group bacterium]|nr:hypothetical protein [Patescibacteria group bacterium]